MKALDKKQIGKNIAFIRKQNKVTLDTLAEAINITKDELKEIEAGTKGTKAKYIEIATFFGVEEDSLINGVLNKNATNKEESIDDNILKIRVEQTKPNFIIWGISILFTLSLINLFTGFIAMNLTVWFMLVCIFLALSLFAADYFDNRAGYLKYKPKKENPNIVYIGEISLKIRNNLILCETLVLVFSLGLSVIALIQYSRRISIFFTTLIFSIFSLIRFGTKVITGGKMTKKKMPLKAYEKYYLQIISKVTISFTIGYVFYICQYAYSLDPVTKVLIGCIVVGLCTSMLTENIRLRNGYESFTPYEIVDGDLIEIK